MDHIRAVHPEGHGKGKQEQRVWRRVGGIDLVKEERGRMPPATSGFDNYATCVKRHEQRHSLLSTTKINTVRNTLEWRTIQCVCHGD